ncbi:MAG: FAD-dependent monooxygenase [Nocardiaceae bacterium]|nr:FAD-dependent monooxygenase [Nocardiaceae bacterium]
MPKLGDHAVVLGASMGGLLCARVLSDFYAKVTIIERDNLPTAPENRRGVPQGRHAHALSPAGAKIIGEMFPGLTNQLVADGVPAVLDGDLSRLFFRINGYTLCRNGFFRRPEDTYSVSRPFLEAQVRDRIRGLDRITILDGHEFEDFVIEDKRVSGVTVVDKSTSTERTLSADLVVDSLGRAGKTPAFLEKHGFGRPLEDHVVVRVTYATQLLRLPEGSLSQHFNIIGPTPDRPTGFALFGYENNTWIFTVIGMVGIQVEPEFGAMRDFVSTFAPADMLKALGQAETIAEPARHKFPSSQWRRYDKLRTLPDGLIVTGDAICSFNPIYGQGMSVAALDAQALQKCLSKGTGNLPRRFFKATSSHIMKAWQTSTGADLGIPGTEGPLTRQVKFINSYMERYLRAAQSDPVLAEKFYRVTGLLDHPATLMKPSIMARVFTRRPVGDLAVGPTG